VGIALLVLIFRRAGLTMPDWLNKAVLYQIHPQSLADSNGSGSGDLPGVADRLDYPAWLGVTTIRLNPIFISPVRDAGARRVSRSGRRRSG